jgi:hypothetical protein
MNKKYISWQDHSGLEYEVKFNGSKLYFGKQSFIADIELELGLEKGNKLFEEIRKIVCKGNVSLYDIRELLKGK